MDMVFTFLEFQWGVLTGEKIKKIDELEKKNKNNKILKFFFTDSSHRLQLNIMVFYCFIF